MATHGRGIGKALCEVLGLDPNQVYELEIKVPCNGAVAVVVERRFPDVEAQAVRSVFDRYHLEKDDEP